MRIIYLSHQLNIHDYRLLEKLLKWTDDFIINLLKLATFDKNMKIRDHALKTLDRTYNRKI